MKKLFVVRYAAGQCCITEITALVGIDLDKWLWVHGGYEMCTASIEEAIRVAHTCCFAVRQEFADLSVDELLGHRAACYDELDKHPFHLERRRWEERISCVEEELRARLGAVEGMIDLPNGWKLTLAGRQLNPKELAATGYRPDKLLFVKQLFPDVKTA